MSDKFVECGAHGQAKPAFICHHLLEEENVGWYEPEEYELDDDDEFAGCLNAWCEKCEEVANKSGGWNDESEAFAQIKLVCESCALRIKQANLK